MKITRLVPLLLLLVVGLAACQKSPESGISRTSQSNVSAEPYPFAEQPAAHEAPAYPYPSLDPQASLPLMVYPELKDGDMLEWGRVQGSIYSGLVVSVFQKHDLQVAITFKDGRTFLSNEPAIDDIIKIIQQCGDLCKDIKVVTE